MAAEVDRKKEAVVIEARARPLRGRMAVFTRNRKSRRRVVRIRCRVVFRFMA